MKILLAVDHSESSREAVNQVASRPWPPEASIEVVHAVEPMHMWATSEVAEELKRRSQAVVDDAVAALRERGYAPAGRLLEGDPKRVILEHAAKIGVNWIVLGARGTTGMERLLLGSVSGAIMRHAPCSVEIVRRRSSPPRDTWKILLATDGSDSAEHAALSVANSPWPKPTEVRIVSAAEFVAPTLLALFEPPGIEFKVNEERHKEAMRHALNAVESATRTVSATCGQVTQSVSVLMEPPGKIILDEADAWDPDLIVVGSHGRRGVGHFLMGSVSETVATHAHCSVAVVRARKP